MLTILFHKRQHYKAGLADSNSVIAYSSQKLFNDNEPKENYLLAAVVVLQTHLKIREPCGWGMQPLSQRAWMCILFKVHFTSDSGEDLALREKTMWDLLTALCRSVIQKYISVQFFKVRSLCSVFTRRVCVYDLASLLHIFLHLKVF